MTRAPGPMRRPQRRERRVGRGPSPNSSPPPRWSLCSSSPWRGRAPTPSPKAVLWGATTALFASGIPFAFILLAVRRRRLTDHHVRLRAQRPLPLLFGLASVVVGLALIRSLGAPQELVALVGAMVVGLLVALLITLRWKISIHTAVTSGSVATLVLVFGPALVLLAPVVALVGCARVAVRDHTPAQVVAGAAVGTVVAAVVFSALR